MVREMNIIYIIGRTKHLSPVIQSGSIVIIQIKKPANCILHGGKWNDPALC